VTTPVLPFLGEPRSWHWKLEVGNWKLEIENWGSALLPSFYFPFSNLQFPSSNRGVLREV